MSDEVVAVTNAVLEDLIKSTFGENFGVSIQSLEEGKHKIVISTLILSTHDMLSDTFNQDRQFIAQSLNNHAYNAMIEIADECLKLSNHIRSKLL